MSCPVRSHFVQGRLQGGGMKGCRPLVFFNCIQRLSTSRTDRGALHGFECAIASQCNSSPNLPGKGPAPDSAGAAAHSVTEGARGVGAAAVADAKWAADHGAMLVRVVIGLQLLAPGVLWCSLWQSVSVTRAVSITVMNNNHDIYCYSPPAPRSCPFFVWLPFLLFLTSSPTSYLCVGFYVPPMFRSRVQITMVSAS